MLGAAVGANILGNVSLASMLVSATLDSSYAALAMYAGSKVLLALNTYPQPQSWPIWQEAVDKAAALGVDALILADPGLMAYAADIQHLYRDSAIYLDKLLKGAKPGDLPVQGPIQIELVINLKTAKALGVAVPQSILIRADEVIE